MTRRVDASAQRIRRAAAGDEDAFRGLVREVYPTLRRWALARTGHPDDADELVQQTLIRMHRHLGRFSGSGRLTTWLYRILQNAATDLDRRKAARPGERADRLELEPDPGARDPLRSVHSGRMAAAVRDFLEALPPRQREVLELVDHQGLKAVEVAEMLDIEPVTVRGNLFKARRAVREAMLARYPELAEGYET